MVVEGLRYTDQHATYIHNPEDPSQIGLGFFTRHIMTFDFANKRLYLKSEKRFSKPDKEDMSGLHLSRQAGTTFVYSVDEKSPAYEVGIEQNDVIELVNGNSSSLLTLKTIRHTLQSQDGNRVKLQIKRGNNLSKLEFNLKQVI